MLDNNGIINLSDSLNIIEDSNLISRANVRPRTMLHGEAIATNQFGEVIFKQNNQIVITGSSLVLEKLFNINTPIKTESLNKLVDVNPTNVVYDHEGPPRELYVFGFAVGTGGCGDVVGSVNVVEKFQNGIQGIIPLRYVGGETDFSDIEKAKYAMKKHINGYDAFYIKKFEKKPVIKAEFEDGTELPIDVHNITRKDLIVTYVEMVLKISVKDIREYFEVTGSIEASRFNTLGLVYGIPELQDDGTTDYRNVGFLSALNFNNKVLDSEEEEITITYKVFS